MWVFHSSMFVCCMMSNLLFVVQLSSNERKCCVGSFSHKYSKSISCTELYEFIGSCRQFIGNIFYRQFNAWTETFQAEKKPTLRINQACTQYSNTYAFMCSCFSLVQPFSVRERVKEMCMYAHGHRHGHMSISYRIGSYCTRDN